MGGLRFACIHTAASVAVAFRPDASVGPSSKAYPPPTYILHKLEKFSTLYTPTF